MLARLARIGLSCVAALGLILSSSPVAAQVEPPLQGFIRATDHSDEGAHAHYTIYAVEITPNDDTGTRSAVWETELPCGQIYPYPDPSSMWLRVWAHSDSNGCPGHPGDEAGLDHGGTISVTVTQGPYTLFCEYEGNLTGRGEDCELSGAGSEVTGTVYDGQQGADGHSNRLAGAKVELREGGEVVEGPVATDGNGAYEFPDVNPGDYELRVTLEEAVHDPGVFDVRHTFGDPVWIEVALKVPPNTERVSKDVRFSSAQNPTAVVPSIEAAERDRLADLANIFWRTEQFVRWADSTLGASLSSPDLPRPVEVIAFSPLAVASGAHYCSVTGPICPTPTSLHMSEVRSSYLSRNGPTDAGPENVEWHEFGHHLYAVNVSSEFCPETNHAGYANPSTCDSVSEGIAEFLPAVAWGDVTGTPDSNYDGFGDLESNNWKAWTSAQGAGNTRLEREEFAVAALLWDLTDTGADAEATQVISAADAHVNVTYTDNIALPLDVLWNVITGGTTTVGDLRPALFNESAIPAALKEISIDLDADGTPDVEPLDIPFLMHGFFPVLGDESLPNHGHYDVEVADEAILGIIGTRRNRAVGRTDSFPPEGGVFRTPRSAVPEVPGARLRLSLQDPKGGPVENGSVIITISYPEGTTVREIFLDGSTGDIYLELPPFFSGMLSEGDPLPACDDPSYPVEVEVQGAFVDATSSQELGFDNCEYAQAVSGSDGEFAIEEEFTIPRQSSDLKVKTKLTGGKIRVSGALLPASPGGKVTLQLQTKKSGGWKTISRGKAGLGPAADSDGTGLFKSRYHKKIARKGRGRCRVVAIWGGDSLSSPDKAKSKAFNC